MSSYLLTCVFIGLVSTLAMTTFLYLITYLKLCNVDMVKAIGSWFTHNEKNATLPGMFVHLTAGILFCFVYIFAFGFIPNPKHVHSLYIILGAGIGFVHGVVVALALMNFVAEHHPLAKYQKAGPKTAIYHFIAHVIYGITIGTLYVYLLDAKGPNL